ncbi:hypothetical protein BDW68DRAFT_175307 [Aspergillus falconensis]
MSTEPQDGPGLGDLEKELTCSICTDLLFQPLTLLDCLHTFCGSCLKEWFYTQAFRRSPSTTPRYTCPSCRASVRETRPNATVTTLLDMVLTANPERAKPAAERAEIEERYKHGESVFPPVVSSDNSSAGSDEEDQRVLEGVRQLSLQDNWNRTQTTGHRSRQSSRTRRADSADINGQRGDGRSRRRRDEERAARRERTARTTGRPEDARERTRRIEHQSSLRSLLSLSDTETMEEEILRQIFEEGLLDDIDLDNLEPGQEEELSEPSKISKEDGLNGWRRCLKGHRMIVVGFEDYPEGHRRVIARNLVGGNALKDKYIPPTSSAVQTVSSHSGMPTTESPTTIGDWSWKEGSERRKKASRVRSAWNNDRDRTPVSEPGASSSLNPSQFQSPSTAATSSRRFPPDGGVGLIVHAMWSWYPEEGVDDELMFPRGAEITEAENINDDWYWGCYAGMTGLFPGSHVSVVGEIV